MSVLTRIKNNQITDSAIWANAKIIPGSIVGSLFNASLTMTSDVTITGNLTVQGASTYLTVASTNTYVNDPLIVLNNAFAGSNSYDLGFIFNRGSDPNKAFYWDESSDEFRLITTTETGTTYGSISAETNYEKLRLGNLVAQYDVSTITLTATGLINTTGNISGAVLNGGAINSTGLINTTGNISGATVIAGQFNTTGNLVASQVSTATLNATGFINTLGNISAAVHTGGAVSVTGFINTTGNISGAVVNTGALNATGTTTLVAVNSTGFIQTTGNVSAAVVNAGALNVTGTTTLAAVNSTGFINTTGNISGAVINGGAINSTGLINTSGNISGAVVNAGQFNTTGNLSASQVSTATLKASALTSGRVVFTSTSGLLVDNAGISFTANTLTVGGALPITIDGTIATIATTTTNQDLILAPNGSGVVDFNATNASNIADPTSAQDAVTKSYLESALSSDVTNIQNDDTRVTINDSGAAGNIVVDVDDSRSALFTVSTITLSKNTIVSNSTASTTTSSGALVVTGGVGIGGNITVGARFKSTDDTQSTSTTTGAIITAGGVGIAKNLTVGGDATITGNLTVQGVLTAIQSTTLEVNDLQVTLAKGAGSSAAADGAGINVDYGNVGANITYTHATTSWNFNRAVIGSTYANFGGNVLATNFVGGGVNVSGNLLATTAVLNALTVNGGITSTGFFNTTANISAAVVNGGAINSTGLINTTGNISGAVVNAGALNVTGTTTLVAVNSTGFINTTGNISAAIINTGALNSTGFINTTGNVSAVELLGRNLTTRSGYGNINLTQYNSIFADGNGSQNIVAIQLSTTGLSDGMGMLGTTGLDGQIYSTRGIAFRTGVTVSNTDTPQSGVIKVAITAAGDLWANATTPASNTTTGAFVVKGGVGIGGNLYAGAGIQDTAIGNVTAASGAFTTLSATGTTTLVAVNSTGFINTTGNISGAVVNTGALNATGTTTLVAVNSTGFINTTGNISGAVLNGGAINSTGFINTTANVSAAVVNTGALNATGTTTLVAVNSTGLINTTGNISASRINADTLAATGTIWANAATDTSSLSTGALIVTGGTAVGKTLWVGEGAVINSTRAAEAFQVYGATGNNGLIYTNTAKNAIVFSSTGNVLVQDGVIAKFDSDGAILIPVGSSSRRPGAAGNVDVAGMLRFNSTSTNLEFHNGTDWTAAGSEFTIITTNSFAGDGVQTAFTLSSSSTTAGTIVAVNGILQIPSTAYSVSGTTLTFTEAPAPGDAVDARVLITTATVSTLASPSGYNTFDVATQPYANITAGTASATVRVSVDGVTGTATFTNDVVINGNLTVKGGSSGNINIGDQSTDIINLQGEIVYDQTALTAIGTNLRQLDSFSTNAYHTAKYLFQIRDGGKIESGEVLLAQDGVNVEITTYAVLAPSGVLGTFQSNISGGQVRWFYTPTTSTYANIKVQSTYIV
jgi:filamentous hemagglutinin